MKLKKKIIISVLIFCGMLLIIHPCRSNDKGANISEYTFEIGKVKSLLNGERLELSFLDKGIQTKLDIDE